MVTIEFNLLELRDGDWLLDAGCGEGRHSWEACKHNHSMIVAFDIDWESLEKNKYTLALLKQKGEVNSNSHLLQADINNLPFKDGAFNRIICSEVLEHIPQDKRAVTELVRVMNSDGTIGVSVPHHLAESICWKLSKDYYGFPGGHIRIYKTWQIIDLLHSNGLGIYAVRRNHALHSIYWVLRCLSGIKKENALIPSLYRKFLVHDIDNKHWFRRCFEGFLNLIFPKSIVIYAAKKEHTSL
jgi:ubiquinone/menaquinone biosynthesis C-methylase UbiE